MNGISKNGLINHHQNGPANDITAATFKKRIRGIDNNGWFTETATMWPGQRFSLALKDNSMNSILFHEQSEYQEILVFESAQYGKVFVIDGILQLTERDCYCFHEMMAHIPLFAHYHPKNVLIVGGGDLCVLKEVCRHEEVQSITLVEIDPMVIHASKEYLKLVPKEIYEDDRRVEIIYADASDYIQDPNNHNKFDIILADTLDPLGPAESLFEPEFYEAMHNALKPNGIVCTQGETYWIHFDLIRDLLFCCADIFDHVEYATTSVPSYPCGQIGFILARKGNNGSAKTRGCSVPVRTPSFQDDLTWYNPQMHKAAFVLPQYVKMELKSAGVHLNGKIGNGKNDDDNNEGEGDRCLLAGCIIQ